MKINDDCSVNRVRCGRLFCARFANKTFYLQLISFRMILLFCGMCVRVCVRARASSIPLNWTCWFPVAKNIHFSKWKPTKRKSRSNKHEKKNYKKRNINEMESLSAVSHLRWRCLIARSAGRLFFHRKCEVIILRLQLNSHTIKC